MKKTILDYLSVTFPLIISESVNEQERSIQTKRLFRDFLGLHDCQVRTEPYATNNFKYQYTLSEFITLRCDGPVNGDGERTCQLEMKGEGCREFERLAEIKGITWVDLFHFLLGLNPNFKRLDTTTDDFDGKEITMNEVFNKTKNKYYTSVFKSKPKYHGIPEDGLTIDFGSRTSSTELCIYDKKKQQESLGKPVEEDYWVRYELRFRGAKADAAVLDLLKNYKNKDDKVYGLNLQSFTSKALYGAIDFKEDNNYSEKDQAKVPTDPKWKAFVSDVEKAKLPNVEQRQTTFETRRAFIMPKASSIIATMYAMKNRDMDLFIHDLLKEMYNLLSRFSQQQKQKLNVCLMENGIEPLSEEEFDKFKLEFLEKAYEMETPF